MAESLVHLTGSDRAVAAREPLVGAREVVESALAHGRTEVRAAASDEADLDLLMRLGFDDDGLAADRVRRRMRRGPQRCPALIW